MFKYFSSPELNNEIVQVEENPIKENDNFYIYKLVDPIKYTRNKKEQGYWQFVLIDKENRAEFLINSDDYPKNKLLMSIEWK